MTKLKVRKAIIPAAGLGTRFLPATKAQPKEMLPIVDRPTIQYIIEEAVDSGIEEILIVTGRGKRAIEDHFDRAYELEETLEQKGKFETLEEIQRISNLVDIHYIRQKEPRGLGHAIWCARKFIGNEPFAVMLGDDIVVSEKPCLKQMIDQYNNTNNSVIGVQEVEEDMLSSYGVIAYDPSSSTSNLFKVTDLVEKPKMELAPSRYAIMGRYVLTPEVLGILEDTKPGAGNEIQLTDALKELLVQQQIHGYLFEGKRYDIGNKLGFIEATLEFALMRDDLRDDVQALINTLAKN